MKGCVIEAFQVIGIDSSVVIRRDTDAFTPGWVTWPHELVDSVVELNFSANVCCVKWSTGTPVCAQLDAKAHEFSFPCFIHELHIVMFTLHISFSGKSML